jgi:hypothetical protein
LVIIHQAWNAGQLGGSEDWEDKNDIKLREFQSWLSAYRWPMVK